LDNIFTTVAFLDGPVGIDYHPPTQSLIVSVNFNTGLPNNFVQLFGSPTNLVVTNWTRIAGLEDEVKVATVKATAHGFTNGDMYFGTGVNGVIGWLSADGTRSNLNWAVLTTNVTTTESLLRGGLYVDQSGSFSGDLIAVTGNGLDEGGGVWRINSSGSPTQLANIPNTHLEGVITLTNDTRKWGPWAGKVIAGAESATNEFGLPRPLVYTVATNGAVEAFDLGIAPEDFLITQAGDGRGLPGGKLFIVHWDSTNSTFVTRSLSDCGHDFEHITFAPIDLLSTTNAPCP